MLEYVIQSTKEFLDEMPKAKRKKIGQFFTSKETAIFMASLFDLNNIPDSISILDPGSGTGILATALIQRILQYNRIRKVTLVCYENNPDVIPVLESNMKYIKENVNLDFDYEIREEDYLLSQSHDFEEDILANKNPQKYDIIIGNPPYLRVLRNHPAAMAMPKVVHGAPNLYFLFSAMALFNLKDNCELVFIIPRSWTSGAYFKAFREYFLSQGKIEHIHLFVSRDKVFSEEQVLQETIIIKMRKSFDKPQHVKLTSTQTNGDFDEITELNVPYDSVVTGEDLYVFLPTNDEDIHTIESINRYSGTMLDIGMKMKTGIIIDFRQYDDLRSEPGEHIIPLFYGQHIKDGRVNHEASGKDYDWVIDEKPGLIQKNKDYIFCKRFTAKEERRRLQCGLYFANDFPEYENIGTQNKINFIERLNGEPLKKEELFGVFALFNSTLFDQYYRILNGSTQVNSTEVNSIPVPPLDVIRDIGRLLIESGQYTTEACDQILVQVAYA